MTSSSICVAFGGNSPEHEVSVISAIQAMQALKERGKDVLPLYITKSDRWLTGDHLTDIANFKDLNTLEERSVPCHFQFDELGKARLFSSRKKLFGTPESWNIDVVVMAFHGSDGENGAFQGLLESYNIAYTGSGHTGAAVAMDKEISKKLCGLAGINITESISFYEFEWVKSQEAYLEKAESIGFPLMVKPINLGSSIGVKRVENRDELTTGIETAFRFDERLIVEEAITPLIEINCSVMGTPEEMEVSVCEMPKGSEESLSFEDKYMSGESSSKGMASANRIIPAPISEELTEEIQSLSKKIFKTLQAAGLVRIDFLVHAETQKVYFNEINTIPGSFSFYLWKESDISFEQLLLRLIEIAKKVHHKKNGRVRSYETNLLNVKSSQGIKGLKGTK